MSEDEDQIRNDRRQIIHKIAQVENCNHEVSFTVFFVFIITLIKYTFI